MSKKFGPKKVLDKKEFGQKKILVKKFGPKILDPRPKKFLVGGGWVDTTPNLVFSFGPKLWFWPRPKLNNEIRALERIEEHFIRKLLNTTKACPISQLYLEVGQEHAKFEMIRKRLLYF